MAKKEEETAIEKVRLTRIKVKQREKELSELGFLQNSNDDYVLGDFVFLLDDIIASSDEHYSELFDVAKIYALNPVDYKELGRFTSKAEASEYNDNHGSEIIRGTHPISGKPLIDLKVIEVAKNHVVVEKNERLFNYNDATQEMEFNNIYFVVPKQLIIDTPNDLELGSLVRKMLSNE